MRLYCIPFAGGGPLAFRQWHAHFPHTEIWAVHLPGRESRLSEPAHTDMDALMNALVPVIASHADRPFALFGHSMGAMIAFELTRRLEGAGGVRPIRLFVSGHGAPSSGRASNESHRLPHDQFIERIRKFNGTPDEVLANEELLEIFLPLLRADITLLETYAPEWNASVECPITALGAKDDAEVPVEAIGDWRAHTHAEFEQQVFTGGHFYWVTDPAPMWRVILASLTGAGVFDDS